MGDFWLFLLVAFAVSTLIHLLIGWRLLGPFRLRGSRQRIAWALVGVSTLTLPLPMALTTLDEAAWTGTVQLVCFVWAGYISILVAFVLVRDGLWFGYRLLDRATPDSILPPLNERRRKFLLAASSAALSGFAAIVAGVGGIRALMRAEIVEVEIPISGLNQALDGFRIAQISDLHVSTGGVRRSRVREIVEAVNRLGADMVALTGLGFDLQLSGHTHAGQYFPYTWVIRLVQSFVAGLYRVGDTWLYVNKGTTWWGPPLRLGAPPEITLLKLVRA